MYSRLTAHGEKLRGKKESEGRREEEEQRRASVSMATATSPTATNFLLC